MKTAARADTKNIFRYGRSLPPAHVSSCMAGGDQHAAGAFISPTPDPPLQVPVGLRAGQRWWTDSHSGCKRFS